MEDTEQDRHKLSLKQKYPQIEQPLFPPSTRSN